MINLTTLTLVAGVLATVAWLPASALERVSLYSGVESYSWREYDASGGRILEESGPRFFVGISDTKDMDPYWEMAFDMRVYAARVHYDGQTNTTPPQPLTTQTDYHGLSAELSATCYLNGIDEPYRWGIFGALGADAWQRHINSTSGVSGYVETYHIGYGRLGLAYVGGYAWRLTGGIKYPFSTDERVGLSSAGYDDVDLVPTPQISAFFSVRYRLSWHWVLGGYYDSYRFDKSPVKTLTSGGVSAGTVWQPRIEQDRYGISLFYQF